MSRILLLAFWRGLPGSRRARCILLWTGDFSAPRCNGRCTVLIVGVWLGFAFACASASSSRCRRSSNLLAALREGDFSIRGRVAATDDALGEVMREVNTLGSTLREQRLGALEATTLLRTVMGEIDVAIFAFDEHQRLRLVNRAGERLLAQPAGAPARPDRRGARPGSLPRRPPQTHVAGRRFPGGAGRWGVRRTRRSRARPAARAARALRPHAGPAASRNCRPGSA